MEAAPVFFATLCGSKETVVLWSENVGNITLLDQAVGHVGLLHAICFGLRPIYHKAYELKGYRANNAINT